ncbi:MAG: prepilin-type N-terminal cleavage/methylation domain-containing protein [Clostridia bacterium]|nr:prepilin-type N-terminal cleavage/methylation domain-containing protein [Clostridia bacterium]
MQKKSGFTLVEIIVVIAISSIVLTMVGTTMVFMTNVSGDLLEEAEDIDMAKNIEKYLRGLVNDDKNPLQSWDELKISFPNNDKNNNAFFRIDDEGNIKEISSDKPIFSDTGLVVFYITEKNVDEEDENDFVICYMEFDSGKHFEFILGPVN